MDYEGFKEEILKMTKINLTLYKEKQMKRRIDALIKKNNFNTYKEYVQALKDNKDLFKEFINYLTINVSEFYRNPDQWAVLEKEIFPLLMSRNKKLNIWSSACSTGDEPYTLVMVLNKMLPLSSIKILATDIDMGALEKAKTGIYTSKSLENLPKEMKEKYFTMVGDNYRVKDEVKNCVEFRQFNLLRDPYPTGMDLIVCRNVLIYFTEEAKNDIYKKFNMSLNPQGILFVGSTEQMIMANKYNFKSVKTFFYVKDADSFNFG
ncbi:CheR family methyltransferase [Ruminiclostridium cellobioparum]|uniref:protein-glutamate O-methyltransferase n=1 Tax=Ruminiclostridium cellobioparum subsp. termitidis CT1112 TaxID=1195236 RepID=S0FXK4_RUMCE|nr:protein-glutamate O-methyltransferase CheR [Ruminiclostridium cellobioparum]EMS73308.1 CheR-type MCP methyltransferase [Ruminiclostridium cellobioparum subsp. termitidis CT1112]